MTDTVQLPENWRELISRAVPFTITRLIDSWRVGDAAALPTPPAEASKEEVADQVKRISADWSEPISYYDRNLLATGLRERFVITRREATDG